MQFRDQNANPLTKLPGNLMIEADTNRRLMAGDDVAVLYIDLDHFKAVNDGHGHLAGDKVLKEVARRVQKTVRPYDLFGRYGGEEFIILMPDINRENAITATERVRQCVRGKPVEFEGREISVTASFGIARVLPGSDMDQATRCADEALYRAKKEGRDRAVFYEDGGGKA